MTPSGAGSPAARTWDAVRRFSLGLPGAWEDFPWGEVVVKVNKKIFVFLGSPDARSPGLTLKLTDSHDHALSMEGAAPAGYGLGKAGWVHVPITGLEEDLLSDWVEESYRNVAPRRLVADLDRSRSGES